jgi:hypothetical protein
LSQVDADGNVLEGLYDKNGAKIPPGQHRTQPRTNVLYQEYYKQTKRLFSPERKQPRPPRCCRDARRQTSQVCNDAAATLGRWRERLFRRRSTWTRQRSLCRTICLPPAFSRRCTSARSIITPVAIVLCSFLQAAARGPWRPAPS